MQRANLSVNRAANRAVHETATQTATKSAKPTTRSLRICLAIALPLLLGACQNMRTVEEANARVQAVHQNIERLRAERVAASGTEAVNGLPMLEEHNGAWIARGSVAIDESDVIPARFYENASFNSSRPLPLSMVAEQIAIEQKVLIHLNADVLKPPADQDRVIHSAQDGSMRAEPKIHLNFRGTLRGLLDTLAMRSGTYWTYREGAIQFSRYKTRTFQIASMPGKSNYTAQVGNKTTTESSGSSGGSGSGSASSAMQMGTGGTASVSTQTDLSYWDEANTTIQSMLSPAGKSTSSTVTNSITVTDTADVIDKVRRFVDRENAVLGRQVHLRVQVYSVKLKTNAQSGIDWNLAFESTGVKFGMGLGTTLTDTASATWLKSPWKDSRLMIAALQTQGDVSTVIDTSIVTLNNQPAPIAVTNNLTYVAKVSVTDLNNGSSGGGGRMYTAEPGLLTTGFILNLMPTLLDNRSVMLQVQLNLSSIISKEKVDLGKNGDNGHITTPETSAIQTLQRASLKSDETLILTGFRRDNNDNQRKGLFDLATGYSKAERQQEEVVVLITPQLVEGV